MGFFNQNVGVGSIPTQPSNNQHESVKDEYLRLMETLDARDGTNLDNGNFVSNTINNGTQIQLQQMQNTILQLQYHVQKLLDNNSAIPKDPYINMPTSSYTSFPTCDSLPWYMNPQPFQIKGGKKKHKHKKHGKHNEKKHKKQGKHSKAGVSESKSCHYEWWQQLLVDTVPDTVKYIVAGNNPKNDNRVIEMVDNGDGSYSPKKSRR